MNYVGIDFDEYSNLSGLNAVISMFDDVIFTECKNFPYRLSCLRNVKNIDFMECGNSLEDISDMICCSCGYEYLSRFKYKHTSIEYLRKEYNYRRMKEFFECETFIVHD